MLRLIQLCCLVTQILGGNEWSTGLYNRYVKYVAYIFYLSIYKAPLSVTAHTWFSVRYVVVTGTWLPPTKQHRLRYCLLQAAAQKPPFTLQR